MKYANNIFFLLGLVCLMSSCEKIEGCMDEDALNYDITAEVNKGCIYCNSAPAEELNTFNDYLVENRFNSEFFQDTVLQVRIEHRRQEFEFQQCGQSGCVFSFIVTDVTDHSMQGFQVQFEVPLMGGFDSYFFQVVSSGPFINLEPGETKDITSILFQPNTSSCMEMVDSGFSFTTIFNGNYIE